VIPRLPRLFEGAALAGDTIESVDFPTFGLPTITTVGGPFDISSDGSNARERKARERESRKSRKSRNLAAIH
jgi:hypothetical protein